MVFFYNILYFPEGPTIKNSCPFIVINIIYFSQCIYLILDFTGSHVCNILYITPCLKCGFTHASRVEIRVFTPRDIKFRTTLLCIFFFEPNYKIHLFIKLEHRDQSQRDLISQILFNVH